MAGSNDEKEPTTLSPGPAPEAPASADARAASSDDSAVTAVNTPSPPLAGPVLEPLSLDPLSPTTLSPNTLSPSHLPLPAPRRPPRRPLPSESATALATHPAPEARRRSNATRSTRHILLHFTGSAPGTISLEEQKRRDEWEARRKSALEALERLREPTRRSQISHFWRVKTGSETLRLHHEPGDYDAREACRFWFPAVEEVPVLVCDFWEGGGSRQVTTLAKIEDFLDERPKGVQVRWIHVPLGKGLLQSTTEDIFRYTGSGESGKPFHKGTIDPSWSYPELSMLNFVNHTRYIEKMDALRLLETHPALSEGPTAGGPLAGLSDRMARDVVWRAGHVGLPANFWDVTRSGLPNPLPERFLGQASLTNVKGALPTADNRQAICEHVQFENSMLMSSQLRAFHRSDGFVLTFANQTGVDYLGQPFQDWLNQPESFMADSDVSVLAHIAESFMHSGTSRWHYPTVEWLVVYILTEAAVVPHNIRQGRNSTSLLTAYQDLAREMKQTQKRPWERGESPKLVRRYLNCLEELRAIADLAAQKLESLRGMALDAERFEDEYQMEGVESAEGDEVESMGERIAWAVAMVEEQRRDAAFLVDYFHTALNELFQLRSIEQNEMAIVADSQNKAVLLFTGVTIVFLPLSFFTSYFGMNLRGVADTNKGEGYFWGLCGSIAMVMVLGVVGFAFRKDLRRRVGGEFGIGLGKVGGKVD